MQNNTKTINSLSVYDGQSQTVTLAPGGSFTSTYQTTGAKTLTFTANFSNSTTQTVQGIITITGIMGVTGNIYPVVLPCDPISPIPYKATTPFADYITGASKYGEGEIGYYYAGCSNKKITKPIIILDGFDPGDERDVSEIYGLLNYNDASGISRNFGEEMRALGYDIIVVNFPSITEGYDASGNVITRDGGADYIERNAFVLTRLINDINTQLLTNGSAEKITIVGPSMGGQISRYALAYLEKTGVNHNCKLWVSFDSPHLGANIPIGDQWWLDYYARVGGLDEAIKKRDNSIGAVASKQLLIHHYLANSVAAAGAPNFRITYDQNLHNNGVAGSNGYPKNLRKVAITNGSGAGRLQPQGTSCGEVLQMDVYTRTYVRLLRLIGVPVNFQVSSSNIYFRPDKGATCKVFDGWFAKFSLSNYHNEEKFAQTPSYTTGYDVVPGGKYNTQAAIEEAGSKKQPQSKQKFSNVVPNHAFIPTVSALDLSTANTIDWADNLSNRNLTCSPNVAGGKETPFDSYFTPAYNEDHVFLTAASVDWIKKEISGQPQPPSVDNVPVNSIQLTSGYEPICTNTASYQLVGLAPNTAVTWTASPATVNLTVNSINSSIVTVSRISNGTVTLTATASLCGPIQASRYIRVGGYSSGDYPVTGSSSGTCGSYVYFSTNQLPGATSYTWFYPGGWSASGYTTNNLSILIPSGTTSGNY